MTTYGEYKAISFITYLNHFSFTCAVIKLNKLMK